jgi:PiT family inorganic phosphate transporter
MEVSTIFLLATIAVAFYSSFMGGANDLANSMGTSVGSGVLTHKKAVIVAAITTFTGAILVGQYVTATIGKGIVDPSHFLDSKEHFVYGMFAAIFGSGLFLNIANYFGLPVSTTHSIVGAVAGFGIVAQGASCINWKNILKIAGSWVTSPLLGGILGFIIFVFIRKNILESKKPKKAAQFVLPVSIVFVMTTIILSFLHTGLKNIHFQISFLASSLIALAFSAFLGLYIGWRIHIQIKKKKSEYDIIDKAFRNLQVVSASFVAFAYGANDVGNGVGPLVAIVKITGKNYNPSDNHIPFWIILLGAVGIVTGLAVFGARVLETVGKKITEITPLRGFSAEFSAATTVLLASRMGMPISTTHTLVGAVIGVGLARGMEALDLGLVRKIIYSWLLTIPASVVFSAIIYYLLIKIF